MNEATIEQMAAVLRFRSVDGLWHARAEGSSRWGHGETPQEAMNAAVADDKEHGDEDQDQ